MCPTFLDDPVFLVVCCFKSNLLYNTCYKYCWGKNKSENIIKTCFIKKYLNNTHKYMTTTYNIQFYATNADTDLYYSYHTLEETVMFLVN